MPKLKNSNPIFLSICLHVSVLLVFLNFSNPDVYKDLRLVQTYIQPDVVMHVRQVYFEDKVVHTKNLITTHNFHKPIKHHVVKPKSYIRNFALQNITKSLELDSKKAIAKEQYQKMLLDRKYRYMLSMKQSIQSNWINQFAAQELTVVFKLQLTPKGNISQLTLFSSSGNREFDRQAELAIRKSAPFSMPEDPKLLKQFQSIILPFSNKEVL
ncbi:MAG: hypothetical protein COB50_00095 [Thiotrichales bacterium]|nr:MAG: hypothetical protein COB50_00095 [Thiotrichales bacterium]